LIGQKRKREKGKQAAALFAENKFNFICDLKRFKEEKGFSSVQLKEMIEK
jgi:hypothetical protein